MTVSFLLKRFVQGAELGGMTRHELWMSNITPEILTRLGISPAASRADDAGSGGDVADSGVGVLSQHIEGDVEDAVACLVHRAHTGGLGGHDTIVAHQCAMN